MELIERLSVERIKHLNAMKYAEFKPYAKSSCKNEEERKKQFDMLKSFCQTNIKCRGEVKRIYSYTEKTPLEVGGRLYCGNSLQGIPKKIRGFLLDGIATDVDMKNCHPKILRYLCKINNNIHCPELEYYINHRDEILDAGDREKLKTMYLCALNTDEINKKTKDTNFKKFDKECKDIQKQITGKECYKHIVDSVPTNRSWNWLGSAINRILCVYENKILQEVINFLNRKEIEIAALCFDGLLMYGNYYDNMDLLIELEEYIETKFPGLKMEFDYKEHADDISMDNTDEELDWIDVDPERTYEAVKERFEETHCKIINRNVFIRQFENRIVLMKKEQIKNSYENMKYDEKNEEEDEIITKGFLKRWLEDEAMNTYDDLGVFPTGLTCPENYFNTWRPFDMELIEQFTYNDEAVNIIKNHIKILCGNDDVVADYFEKWIAQMIQYPAVKSICPTLISDEGAGKGTLLQLLTKMLGPTKVFETTQPSRDVWGEFNGLMADAFLVNLNELSKKETVESEGRIKGLITDPTMKINNKGVSQFPINSFHRFIITTNNEEPISTSKKDRRKLIIRSSDELCGNKEYFKKMYELLDDTNVVKSVYKYFKSIPEMDKFGSIPMPTTEHQENLKEMNANPIESWLKDFVERKLGNPTIKETSKKLYEDFDEWINNSNITNYQCDALKFAVRLKNLKLPYITKDKGKQCNSTLFDIEGLSKHFGIGCLIAV